MILIHKAISAKKKKVAGGTWQQARKAAVTQAIKHINYIQHRPGEDRPQGGRQVFDKFSDETDIKAFRQRVREMGTRGVVMHKLTFSPVISPQDEAAFTRDIMEKLESFKGLDLDWCAVTHRNTDNNHIHVEVRGVDWNGRSVFFSGRDRQLMKEVGDDFLDREQPGMRVKELKARDVQKEKERKTRKELPWLRKKIIREQLQPYSEWKREKLEREASEALLVAIDGESDDELKRRRDKNLATPIKVLGRDYSQQNSLTELKALVQYLWDHEEQRVSKGEFRRLMQWIDEKEHAPVTKKIRARGSEYSPANTLDELKSLEQHLRNNYADRISKPDFRQLREWIEEKEHGSESRAEGSEPPMHEQGEFAKKIERFRYQGKEYSKDSELEELFHARKLAMENRHSKETRLQKDHAVALYEWIEDKDREKFSGVLDEELYRAKLNDAFRDDPNDKPQRWEDPHGQDVNQPFLKVVLAAHSFIRSVLEDVPTDWSHRDHLKDQYDAADDKLKDAKAEAGPQGQAAPEMEQAIKDLEQERIKADRKLKKRIKKKFQDKLKQKEDREKEDRDSGWL